MPACPECLFGVGADDTKCGHCGATFSREDAHEAEAERFLRVPKPPYLLGESVIPIVLCLIGIGSLAAGVLMFLTGDLTDVGSDEGRQAVTKLTALVSMGAMTLLFGTWGLLRQRARHRMFSEVPEELEA